MISFAIIFWLIYAEVKYYLDSRFVFKFSPDTDFDAKLKINVDLTIAMPCTSKLPLIILHVHSLKPFFKDLGADILDSTNQNAFKFGSLDEEDTWFELDANQKNHFDNKRHFNSYLREEYHAIKVS